MAMFIQNILQHSAGEILANRLIKQVFESVLLSVRHRMQEKAIFCCR